MILLIFPHQLFAEHPGLSSQPSRVLLLEDSLFFGDQTYPAKFHKQKLWLHRATMKRYEARLREQGYDVQYVGYQTQTCSLQQQLDRSIGHRERQSETLCVVDPTDYLLAKRLGRAADRLGMNCEVLSNPGFLNSKEENLAYRAGKKRWFMADFYKSQRRRLDVLIDDGGEPAGGQWSFDKDNRKKVPKRLLPEVPGVLTLERETIEMDAKRYVEENFPDHPGSLETLYYPTSHSSARNWLDHFLVNRFEHFGPYEDAIVEGESWLWHSVLTPAMNIGLLTPHEVVATTLRFARDHEVPLNSLEGFLRQIIGWREFIRATYEDHGVVMRTTNHWNHHREMPKCFYDASTGVAPIDDTIARILETGYCHHIERLMVLGGFMFLCEIDPGEIYRWFMEMFVDSYDWVMVPNVYAMSQNADGGMITTKPYFSGSSYIRKMSHYKSDPWCQIWDGLYWRWIWNHAEELGRNPRWAMMCSQAKKMKAEQREQHLARAEDFLGGLR
jgi:deoxyribodipyrimidine photolyase-related protein